MKWKSKSLVSLVSGNVICVDFENVQGDAASAPVGAALRSVIEDNNPAGLILDFTQSRYSSGDGICGVVVCHKLPTRIVASGSTGRRIGEVLEMVHLLQLLGRRIFETRDLALADLLHEIEAEAA